MEAVFAKIVEFLRSVALDVWTIWQSFLQTKSLMVKYTEAHKIGIPLIVLWILLVWLLDTGEDVLEKLLRVLYFALVVELIIFGLAFVTVFI